MKSDRRQGAYRVRLEAAELARGRHHPNHVANGDEQRYAALHYAMSFTKGLKHDCDTGLVEDPGHFEAFRRAIDEGYIDPFTASVPGSMDVGRSWEAPTAGVVYDLEGPDSQAVTMPPAPALGSDELAFEMAEVYELALLRDENLTDFAEHSTNTTLQKSVKRLNKTRYATDRFPGRSRKVEGGLLTPQTVFRGSSPGVEEGPYLSQFLLIGNVDQTKKTAVETGKIQFGAQLIDQRVPVAVCSDYMTKHNEWLAVQNGADTRCDDTLFDAEAPRRFITTPRDLATYVHDDALYQAYLNACLILLSMKTPFDPGFAQLSGQGKLLTNHGNSNFQAQDRQAGGFALYGGPHILTLVTEVATRALKAVRYQKFNNHIRLRPEALAARIEYLDAIEARFNDLPKQRNCLTAPLNALKIGIRDTVKAVETHNKTGTALLPMAFQEGSPMHPSYGAGHATVAGACVTILKAYFDTGAVFAQCGEVSAKKPTYMSPAFQKLEPTRKIKDKEIECKYRPVAFTASKDGSKLVPDHKGCYLTLEGELNKLAANISIGRNMAGVHYFSDYYDSVRMGEEIAIGLLEEQALCYPTDDFVLSIPTFDGGVRRIGRR